MEVKNITITTDEKYKIQIQIQIQIDGENINDMSIDKLRETYFLLDGINANIWQTLVRN